MHDGHPQFKELKDAKEIDLVYTGLEEIMTTAVKKHWMYSIKEEVNLRDACYMSAINDINQTFADRGMLFT